MALTFQNGEWCISDPTGLIPLNAWAQDKVRAVYLYNLNDVERRLRHVGQSGLRIHYAMKANAHRRLLRLVSQTGAGVDVVSLGELQKALGSGFAPDKIIFSGVAKDVEDLRAALRAKIYQVNVESFEELKLLSTVAEGMNAVADVGLRLNIHLAAPTHKHIQTATEESKFGMDLRLLPEILSFLRQQTSVRLKGLAVHIGSQIMDTSVFRQMSTRMGELYREVLNQGFPLGRLDLGGGLGVDYRTRGEDDLSRWDDYARALSAHQSGAADVMVEPGRFLVARCGVLLAKVVRIKHGVSRDFAILNAGMTALMRPALYQAYHQIEALRPREERCTYDVVGPICESTDVLAESRELSRLEDGDWVGLFDTGAYGAVMASSYNETPRLEQWSVCNGVWEVE